MHHAAKAPIVITGDGSLRSLLAGVDGGSDFVQPVPTKPSTPESRPSPRTFNTDDWHLVAAMGTGFLTSFLFGLALLAYWPAATSASKHSGRDKVIEAINRVATFASIPLEESINQLRPDASILVDVQAQVVIGQSLHLPVSMQPGLVERGATVIRVSNLPPYTGLSAGIPQTNGDWLIAPEAAKDLRLTVYAVLNRPQDITFDALDASHNSLASAQATITTVEQRSEDPAATRSVPAPMPVLVAAPSLVERTLTEKPAASQPMRFVPIANPVSNSQRERVAARAQPPAKPQSATVKAIPVTGKAKPAKPDKQAALVQRRAAKPVGKTQIPPKSTQTAVLVTAPVAKDNSLNWSNNWQRSTLGMPQ
jgi:hypothetical protein